MNTPIYQVVENFHPLDGLQSSTVRYETSCYWLAWLVCQCYSFWIDQQVACLTTTMEVCQK